MPYHPFHRDLVGDVDGQADTVPVGTCRLLGTVEVRHDDPGAFRGKPVGDRPSDPLGAARHDRHLSVELAHENDFYAIGENGVGTRMRFCWVWISGWMRARNSCQSGRVWSAARRVSRSAWLA